MITLNKTQIEEKKTELTNQIKSIEEEIEELNHKRTTLLEELETTTFKPKRRKIHHELSEICWKLDALQEQQNKLEVDLDLELYY